MKENIHQTSLIEEGAIIPSDCSIGPFCVIGPDVELSSGVVLDSHVVIQGKTKVGENTRIGSFSVLGNSPSDPGYNGEDAFLVIGKNCILADKTIFEVGVETTVVGDNCFFQTGSGIAHDTQVGNNVTFSIYSGTVGNCLIQDNVFIGLCSRLHQRVRIGKGSIIGGNCFVSRDVLPYSMIKDSKMRGLNYVGLKRYGLEETTIKIMLKLYKQLVDGEYTLSEWKQEIKKKYSQKQFLDIVKFLEQETKRNYIIR